MTGIAPCSPLSTLFSGGVKIMTEEQSEKIISLLQDLKDQRAKSIDLQTKQIRGISDNVCSL
jgi:hypothetical protein